MLKKKHLKRVLNYKALLLSLIFFLFVAFLFLKGKSSKLSIWGKNFFSCPFDDFHCLSQICKRTICLICGQDLIFWGLVCWLTMNYLSLNLWNIGKWDSPCYFTKMTLIASRIGKILYSHHQDSETGPKTPLFSLPCSQAAFQKRT